MITQFSSKFIKNNKGCYSLRQVNSLSFIRDKRSVITLEDIVKSELPNQDKIWFIWNKLDFNYEKREECYNQSKKLQKIFASLGGLVFCHSYFDIFFFFGQVGLFTLKEIEIIFNEILKYSKRFS